jgi:hypothetical protein
MVRKGDGGHDHRTVALQRGKPNKLARIVNRGTAAVYALAFCPLPGGVNGGAVWPYDHAALVMAVVTASEILVSMLGEQVDWVRTRVPQAASSWPLAPREVRLVSARAARRS